MTPRIDSGNMKNQNAISLINKRIWTKPDAFAEVVVWHLAKPLMRSNHSYKYRLAYIARSQCVLRYDNELGKGDHRHYGKIQSAYSFSSIQQLMSDFAADITRWHHENRYI